MSIDVLEVMARISRERNGIPELDAARAAVAELLAAIREIADYEGGPRTPIHNSIKKSAIARSAIAKATGATA